MQQLLDETRRMSLESVRFARGVSHMWPPTHLIPLLHRVRDEQGAELRQIRAAIDEQLRGLGATPEYVDVFYAASEMAQMELVARDELAGEDRRTLRRLWEDLLAA